MGAMQEHVILGPFRVQPGRLSVSRTFGDIEAKKTKYGGNPRVVIAEPEVKAFKISNSYDFILLACNYTFLLSNIENIGDGVFDKLENKDVM
jgi:protein phosphatase 2C family protein 2/3